MDWYYNTQFSDPDDDDCSHDETEMQADGVYCVKCGKYLGTPEDLGVELVSPQSESEGEGQPNTGLQSDDGQVAAIEGGYDYVPEGYSVCPVCRSMSFFNDECQFCGFGSDDGIPPVAAKA